MMVQTFNGVIDDQVFANYEDFKKYLETHPDAKNVSFSREYKDVVDPEDKCLKKENKVKQDKQTETLYPPTVNIDEFVSEKRDLDELKDTYTEYLKSHAQDIKDMTEEELDAHLKLLYDLNDTYNSLLKRNDNVDDTIVKRLEQLEYEHKKLDQTIKEEESKRDVIKKAHQVLSLTQHTLKTAINDVQQHKQLIKPKEDKLDSINKLIAYLFGA